MKCAQRFVAPAGYLGSTLWGAATLLSPARAAPEDLDTRPVVVFGAGGYTGGDVVRSLLKKGKTVIPVTRRPVSVVARGGKVGYTGS